MSDEPTDTPEETPATDSGDAPASDPSDTDPGDTPAPKARPASATSRARRIGGGTSSTTARPSTGRSTTAKPATGKPVAAKSGTAKPVSTTKPARAGQSSQTPSERGDRTVQLSVPAWVSWVPAAAFLAAAVAVLAFFVADRVGGSGGPDVSQKERQTVLAAAKTCVAAMNTYKYTDLDAYEKAGTRCTTGKLTSQFQTTVNTLIRKAAPTQKFTQTAQINLAGIEDVSKSGRQWSVLVYGQLNITNKGTGKEGRIDPFSVVATMEQHSGRWVIARVQLLSSIGD